MGKQNFERLQFRAYCKSHQEQQAVSLTEDYLTVALHNPDGRQFASRLLLKTMGIPNAHVSLWCLATYSESSAVLVIYESTSGLLWLNQPFGNCVSYLIDNFAATRLGLYISLVWRTSYATYVGEMP